MAVFHVVFDLVMARSGHTHNYDLLFEALKEMDSYELSRNSWFVSIPDADAEAGGVIRDAMMDYIHRNDTVFVMPVDKWYSYSSTQSKLWLFNRLKTDFQAGAREAL